ncbi:MAG: thioredoxin domain-containing protein, partial [Ignavibacteriales bacterium]|nr:thioredoxin domain-containing protein [Ignavibacteriales bacterium]
MVPKTNIIFRTPVQEAEPATQEILNRIDACNKLLYAEREKRQHPFKDDKILLDWKGLMIAALAYAGRIVNEPAYTETAQKAADYLLVQMKASEKNLFHRMRNGEAGIEAMIEDYAFFIFGLTELYQSTFDLQYLEKAILYADKALEDFKDSESAGFYFTDKQFAKVPVRQKEIYDGAIPSANSVMISNMITLSHLTGDSGFDHEANLALQAFSALVEKSPASFTHYLNGYLQALHSHTEVVITGSGQHKNVKRFIREVVSQYNPYIVLLVKDTDKDVASLTKIASFTEGMIAIDNEPTYYICKDFACNMPITRIEDALDII